MSLPTTLLSYNDEIEYLDRALASEKGIRLQFPTSSNAKTAQMRIHQARSLHREEQKRIYEREDPKWGVTPYDTLLVRNPQEDEDGLWWVYISKHAMPNLMSVEEID